MWREVIAVIFIFLIQSSSLLQMRKIQLSCQLVRDYWEYGRRYRDIYIDCSLPEDVRKDEKLKVISKQINFNRLRFDNFTDGSLVTFKTNENYPEHFPMGVGKAIPKIRAIFYTDSPLKYIRRDNFVSMENLYAIFLDDNHIEMLPCDAFYELKSLRTLMLRGNKICELHANLFLRNPYLSNLGMSHNEISKINPELLKYLHILEVVDFAYNQIRRIDEGMFTYNRKMKKFFFQGNKIKYFNINFKDFENLTAIYLLGNDRDCDFIFDLRRPHGISFPRGIVNKWTRHLNEFQILVKYYCQSCVNAFKCVNN